MRAVHQAMSQGQLRACHDCSDGGLAVALAEMVLGGGSGAQVDLAALPGAADLLRDDVALFSESLGRFVVEVAPADRRAFEALFAGLPLGCLGEVIEEPVLELQGLLGEAAVRLELLAIRQAWKGHDG